MHMCLVHGCSTWCCGLVDVVLFSLMVGFSGPGGLFQPQ